MPSNSQSPFPTSPLSPITTAFADSPSSSPRAMNNPDQHDDETHRLVTARKPIPAATLPPSLSSVAPGADDVEREPRLPTTLQAAIESLRRLVSNERQMRILILSSDTGGGHRASAQAISSALELCYPAGWLNIKVVDFWVDFAEGPFINFPSQYTFLAKHPALWKMTYEVTRFPPGRFFTESLFSTFGHDNVRDSFVRFAPDLIISVHPLVNTLSMKVLSDLHHQLKYPGAKRIPYVTVVTDLAGAHPTWFHSDADMTYIPSESVSKTARKCDVPDSRVRIFGLPVRPDFWQPLKASKQELRSSLGLLENVPAVLVVGGGDGVGGLKAIVTALATDLPASLSSSSSSSSPTSRTTPVQIVVICGKNDKLRTWLTEQNWHVPVFALGYVTNMSEWMGAVDIICTKAGPGTIAESLIRGLPLVLTGFLPGQEEANVKLVVDHGVGAFAKRPRDVVKKVSSWLSNPSALDNMSAKARALGRPQASVDIARDMIRLAKQRMEEDLADLETIQQSLVQRRRDAQLRPGLLAPFIPFSALVDDTGSSHNCQGFRTGEEGGRAFAAQSDSGLDSEWRSLLGQRLTVLLRIAIGSLMARDVLTSGLTRPGSRTPPSSPLVERITDTDKEDEDESDKCLKRHDMTE